MKILSIGRKGANIVIDNEGVSRHHAELTVTDNGKYYLLDCGSSNGTEIRKNGLWQPVKQEFVRPEDEVRFAGRYAMTVQELLEKSRP
jgi:pSer/pThr/pTyr-binding forkhead associated (FHA) protein